METDRLKEEVAKLQRETKRYEAEVETLRKSNDAGSIITSLEQQLKVIIFTYYYWSKN